MLTSANGAYNKTIVIREIDDTYLFIKNCEVRLLDRYNFRGFDRIIESEPNKNIIIDGRLNKLIYYAIMAYYDNILIYDIGDKQTHTIYAYISSVYKLPLAQLTLNRIRIWAYVLYISEVCLDDILDIRSGELLKYIISNNCSKNRLTFNYLIDTINNQNTNTIDVAKLKKIYEYIVSLVASFNDRKFIIEPIDAELLNPYHIKSILEVLYSNRFVIDL